jgi:C_GCAxxG_C_C family probable redox protein
LQVLQARHGIGSDDLWQLVTGLGAGMGRQQRVCGALTGGIVACGLIASARRGATREDRTGLRDAVYADVQALTRQFEERFGTTECRAMTGSDFSSPEGRARFRETQGLQQVCTPAVHLVVEALAGPDG